VPLRQLHSDSHNLPDNLGFLGMAQNPDLNRRQRVGLQDDVIATHAAPAASVSVAGFHEVDGTFVLRPPRSLHNFVLLFIHLDEASRRKNRIHGEILVADVAIGKIAVGELG
jgi:hypothetical protein